ncbi:MAG: flagellar biosynthesis protein FlhA [Myxococcota bacterium]
MNPILDQVKRALVGAGEYPVMFGVFAILALMIMPLPPWALDVLLSVNITVSVLVLLTSIYVLKPLDFSVFPALLLMTTLFRLGLNVASTRLILLGAAEGSAEAGNIIQTFGQFVVGGNSMVGIVVFLILVIINFMVITKGSGRIAEVAARFTLDALPGKQMSIDAEMASGAIPEDEAKAKREEVQREADFYGAMDGASKFVRGDAIAGLIITAINILGGLLIGATQGGLSMGDAFATYTVLTVGDGLVSQIPALLISTAAGIIVTRAASDTLFGEELKVQLLGNDKVLYGAAAVLVMLGLIPGMPTLVFVLLAAAAVYLARALATEAAREAQAEDDEEEEEDESKKEVAIEEAVALDVLQLEIGYELISMIDERRNGQMVQRLLQMRRQFAQDMGLMVPPIHIRDNLEIDPGAYRLLLKGNPIGEAVMVPRMLLAIDPGNTFGTVEGLATKDPTFGLDALWIVPDDQIQAESVGYTVVDQESVVTTHLTELVRQHAHELLGWQELQERLDLMKEVAPKLVEELIPDLVSFGTMLRVLKMLLHEGVSIRDLHTIMEALAEHAPHDTSVTGLTEHVRARLAPTISAMMTAPDGTLYAAILARELEDQLRSCIVTQNNEPVLAADLTTAQSLFAEIEGVLGQFAARDAEPVLLAPPDLRLPLRGFLSQFFPNVHVISHREIVSSAQIVSVGQLHLRDDAAQLAS